LSCWNCCWTSRRCSLDEDNTFLDWKTRRLLQKRCKGERDEMKRKMELQRIRTAHAPDVAELTRVFQDTLDSAGVSRHFPEWFAKDSRSRRAVEREQAAEKARKERADAALAATADVLASPCGGSGPAPAVTSDGGSGGVVSRETNAGVVVTSDRSGSATATGRRRSVGASVQSSAMYVRVCCVACVV
jgi:hypothetical protein